MSSTLRIEKQPSRATPRDKTDPGCPPEAALDQALRALSTPIVVVDKRATTGEPPATPVSKQTPTPIPKTKRVVALVSVTAFAVMCAVAVAIATISGSPRSSNDRAQENVQTSHATISMHTISAGRAMPPPLSSAVTGTNVAVTEAPLQELRDVASAAPATLPNGSARGASSSSPRAAASVAPPHPRQSSSGGPRTTFPSPEGASPVRAPSSSNAVPAAPSPSSRDDLPKGVL